MRPFTALRSDTHRLAGRFGWGLLLRHALTNRTFRVIVTLRLCQGMAAAGPPGRPLLPLCQALHRFATHSAAMDLSWRTRIGPGLALTHGWGLVVSPGAVIGANVTLFHGVTIGQRDGISASGERRTTYPVIEDEVWVGPNAIIVGGITIGRGSRIIGGTFVAEDVPPYSVVSSQARPSIRDGCVPDVPNAAPLGSEWVGSGPRDGRAPDAAVPDRHPDRIG